MKKHFLIESIRRNKRPAEKEGWITWDYTSIVSALKNLSRWIDKYNDCKKKKICFEIYSVKGDETAIITLRGKRTEIAGFISYLIQTEFYENFSLKEDHYPDIHG